MQRHRHQEFIRFFNTVEAKVPARKAIHAIVDNSVEGFFAKLSRRRLNRGVFRSLADLQATINRFVTETNGDPKPFAWTADPNKIIAAVRRGTKC